MSAVVQRVLHVVQECEIQSIDTISFNEVDRICLVLSRCATELGELLNSVLVARSIFLDEDTVSSLRELHICVNHLVVEWETRLLRASTGPAPPARALPLGRPRVLINLPLVRYGNTSLRPLQTNL